MRLILVVLALLMCVAAFAAQQYSFEWHVHTNKDRGGFSDGLKSPQEIIYDSLCDIVVFSDHLDGIIEKGTALYLDTIRNLSGTAGTLAIPAVEVTCGYAYATHDEVVLGLTQAALDELATQYKLGAFQDPETGPACVRQIADKYGLTVIAAHPDSDQIPYDLAANAKYCDGFEEFDSKHIGFTAKDFLDNCRKFAPKRALVLAGSDYHFGMTGAIPLLSWKEAPVSQVILPDGVELTEQSVTEAIRKGYVYATSIRGSGLAVASTMPGGVWDRAGNLVLACKGLAVWDLQYQKINVFMASGSRWILRTYNPIYHDGLVVLNLPSDRVPDDITTLNIDFGGRVLTSTIYVKPVSSPTPIATGQQQVEQVSTQPVTVQQTGDPFAGFKRHYKWTDHFDAWEYEWEVGFNDDLKGRLSIRPHPQFPPIVVDIQLKHEYGAYTARPSAGTYDQSAVVDVRNAAQVFSGGPNILQRRIRFHNEKEIDWRGDDTVQLYISITQDYSFVQGRVVNLKYEQFDKLGRVTYHSFYYCQSNHGFR